MMQFRQYSIFIDYSSGPEEKKVYQALSLICATPLGKMILDCFKSQTWILPMEDKVRERCKCAGLTMPMNAGKAGRPDKPSNVYLDVTDQPPLYTPGGSPYQYYSDDDRLCHELAHAYRMGELGFYGMEHSVAMINYLNLEEFFAVQMQNVYLSCRGNPIFYLNTRTMAAVSKADAYAAIASDDEATWAISYLVGNDPLAATVARLSKAVADFNPWRDLP